MIIIIWLTVLFIVIILTGEFTYRHFRKKGEVYFTNVVEVGNLYLDFIIYEFENEPILFICKNEDGKLYLCLCSEIRYEQKWIIVECDKSLLNKLAKKEREIASIFLSSDTAIVVNVNLNGMEESYIVDIRTLDKLDFPKEGIFLHDEIAFIEYLKRGIHG